MDRSRRFWVTMTIPIREMTLADHAAVIGLLTETPGVTVRDADSREAIGRYLARNPGLSFVAVDGAVLAGCVMCGHDGRRGYLHHMAVRPAYQRQGLGSRLAAACIEGLRQQGILKTHLFVFADNEAAHAFWSATGWQRRRDIVMYSYNSSPNANI